MGTGHGRHSKRPDHGAQPSHVEAALREALLALRDVKKALARADARFRQIPPATLNEHPWAWNVQVPMDQAQQQASVVKSMVDRALSVFPRDAAPEPHGIEAAEPETATDRDEALRRAVDDQIRRNQHRGGRAPKDF